MTIWTIQLNMNFVTKQKITPLLDSFMLLSEVSSISLCYRSNSGTLTERLAFKPISWSLLHLPIVFPVISCYRWSKQSITLVDFGRISTAKSVSISITFDNTGNSVFEAYARIAIFPFISNLHHNSMSRHRALLNFDDT